MRFIYLLAIIIAFAQFAIVVLLVNVLHSFSTQSFNITSGFVSEWLTALATLFAAGVALFGIFYTNSAESKRRREEKRTDKFYDHRNTIVQLEHEIIPIRVRMFRNLSVLKDALDNTNPSRTRLILRFDKLNISAGLSLKLLSLDLINKYSELYSLLETINSDFDYIERMVTSLQNRKELTIEQTLSLEQAYITMLPYILDQCERADSKSLKLLTICKLALAKDTETQLKNYQKKGGEIIYSIREEELKLKNAEIEEEEQLPEKDGEPRPKFVSLYLDIVKVPLPNPV